MVLPPSFHTPSFSRKRSSKNGTQPQASIERGAFDDHDGCSAYSKWMKMNFTYAMTEFLEKLRVNISDMNSLYDELPELLILSKLVEGSDVDSPLMDLAENVKEPLQETINCLNSVEAEVNKLLSLIPVSKIESVGQPKSDLGIWMPFGYLGRESHGAIKRDLDYDSVWGEFWRWCGSIVPVIESTDMTLWCIKDMLDIDICCGVTNRDCMEEEDETDDSFRVSDSIHEQARSLLKHLELTSTALLNLSPSASIWHNVLRDLRKRSSAPSPSEKTVPQSHVIVVKCQCTCNCSSSQRNRFS